MERARPPLTARAAPRRAARLGSGDARRARRTWCAGPFSLRCCRTHYLFRLAQNSSKERRLSALASFEAITASATASVW